MGAWGAGAFENDTACDWAYGLEGVTDLSLVEAALAAVTEDGEAPDADTACEALAACEVLARLLGNFGTRDSYTKTADEWAEANPQRIPAALLAAAIDAIDVITGPESELAETWEGDEDWAEAVDELRQRLVAAD